jgi:toxin HigB-1
VKLEFEDKKLEATCETQRSRVRAFGADRAARLQRRLSSLVAASSLAELRNAPGRFHELKYDRKGQLSADLDHPYRLIFKPVIPAAEQVLHANGLDWSKITHVSIIGIADTHD